MASHYRELDIEGVANIIEYETQMPNNIEEIKTKYDAFISIQNYKREQKEMEFREEMGIMTKEDYGEENF